MALHFPDREYTFRMDRLTARLREEKLAAIVLFSQESMYWLTGYDTFGFAFFQTLVVKADGTKVLMTRSPDLRQARHTSNITDIRIWIDRANADPSAELKELLNELDLLGERVGIEYDTQGMTGRSARLIDRQLMNFCELADASYLVSQLRLTKSDLEIAQVERASELADDALDEAIKLTRAGASEAEILSAMQGAVFAGGGDYPASGFVVGSGNDALLCRYKSGRRKLSERDQLTLEWAGVSAHYHSAMMRTIVIGEPDFKHREFYDACKETIDAIELVLRPGNTFGTVFDIHARTMDEKGLARHRLNSCGYSLGARFAPTWVEHQMFHTGNTQQIEPGMTLFVHTMVMDSDSNIAMTLGQTYLTTNEAPRPLSRHKLNLLLA